MSDAVRSKIFSKYSRLISLESKKAAGNPHAPSLKAAIEQARAANMPNDNIERAIKKGIGGEMGELERVTYEGYGPGGTAFIIEGLTGNRNKAASEIKFILSKHGGALAAPGAAVWAFRKSADGWIPNVPLSVSADTAPHIQALIEELEDNDEVQDVYTNAEASE